MTLNNVVKSLSDIGAAHLQINHFFFGEEWDFATSGTVNCPAMIVVLQPGLITSNTIQRNFKIYIGDIVQKDLSNKLEVLSDCEQIAGDVIYKLLDPTFEGVVVNSNSITLNDFEDSFDCELYGYWFEVQLKYARPSDDCAIPLRTTVGDYSFDFNNDFY